MKIFFPQIGVDIANALNEIWGTHISGIAIWSIGLLIALLLD